MLYFQIINNSFFSSFFLPWEENNSGESQLKVDERVITSSFPSTLASAWDKHGFPIIFGSGIAVALRHGEAWDVRSIFNGCYVSILSSKLFFLSEEKTFSVFCILFYYWIVGSSFLPISKIFRFCWLIKCSKAVAFSFVFLKKVISRWFSN